MLLPGYHMTIGVKHLADEKEAYWLLDVILSHQINPVVRKEPFQVWNLVVHGDKSCTVKMTDGNSQVPIVTQVIEYTSFPDIFCTLWLEDKTILLPSEH